jgi:hypothetical protein
MPDRVTELHNIMPIADIPSVLAHGILCHRDAARLAHDDVSMPVIQERRAKVQVPGGLRLHRYANLYFHARNPMLYARQDQVESLCILRISVGVFKIEGTVLTDQNASGKYVRFYAPSALSQLPLTQIYAEDWRHADDQIAEWRHRSQKCAEVLVPHKVTTNYIRGAYVVNAAAKTRLDALGFPRPIDSNSFLFFR